MAIYSRFAHVYDALTADIDYKEWAEFINKLFLKHGQKPKLIVDLACGTGRLTLELGKLGYDLIGIDASEDMLAIAKNRSDGQGCNFMFLRQDMRSFELYGTVDAIVCCLDSINYLTNRADIQACFSLVRNYLNPDGLFIFDINSRYKFESILSYNTFVFDEDSVFCVWQNNYNRKTKICNFYLTFFVKDNKCTFRRFDELHREYSYSERQIRSYLEKAGLRLEAVYGDRKFSAPDADEQRLFFVAKKVN